MTTKLAVTAIVTIAALAVAIGARTGISQPKNGSAAPGKQSHCEWLANLLTEASTVKVGDTRSSLLEVFTTEGGLSTREQRTYVLRKCSLIKVDVEFRPVSNQQLDTNDRPSFTESGDDVIVKISRPYIAWPVDD
jgi:hypothetical protein